MKVSWFSLASLVAVLSSACATPYQPAGFRGGYSEVRLAENEYMVSVSGNGFTPEATLWSYAQQRAQELCAENGYNQWRLVDPNSRSTTSYTNDDYTISSPAPNRIRVQRDGIRVTKSAVRAVVVCSRTKSESVPERHPAAAAPAAGGAAFDGAGATIIQSTLEKQWEEELRRDPPKPLPED